jgi:hypothetical protein
LAPFWFQSFGADRVLKSAVQKARLGRDDELSALKRLDDQARTLEHCATGPTVETIITNELAHSFDYDGRSVFGWENPPSSKPQDSLKLRTTK